MCFSSMVSPPHIGSDPCSCFTVLERRKKSSGRTEIHESVFNLNISRDPWRKLLFHFAEQPSDGRGTANLSPWDSKGNETAERTMCELASHKQTKKTKSKIKGGKKRSSRGLE